MNTPKNLKVNSFGIYLEAYILSIFIQLIKKTLMKKKYRAPKLKVVGKVATLTHAMGSAGGDAQSSKNGMGM